MASCFCCSVERLFFEGQLIFATVAIHAARNSRLTSGRMSLVVGFGDSVTGFVIGFVVTVVGFLGVVVGFWVEHEFINNPVKMSGIYFSLLIFIRAKIEENVLFFKFFNVELV